MLFRSARGARLADATGRFNETPRIRVDLVKNLEAPGGIGEPGTSCVMPALTNAIFAATAKRIRKLPVGDQARTEA